MYHYFKIFIAVLAFISVHFSAFAMQTTPTHKMKQEFADAVPAVDIVLYPGDADLRYASNVIIEPQSAPYNLGGWLTDNVVMFPLELQEAGEYKISIVYSKQASDGSTGKLGVFGVLDLNKDPREQEYFTVHLASTGKNWATYVEKTLGSLYLPKGKVYLTFWDQKENKHEYVMNLREVRLQKY